MSESCNCMRLLAKGPNEYPDANKKVLFAKARMVSYLHRTVTTRIDGSQQGISAANRIPGKANDAALRLVSIRFATQLTRL